MISAGLRAGHARNVHGPARWWMKSASSPRTVHSGSLECPFSPALPCPAPTPAPSSPAASTQQPSSPATQQPGSPAAQPSSPAAAAQPSPAQPAQPSPAQPPAQPHQPSPAQLPSPPSPPSRPSPALSKNQKTKAKNKTFRSKRFGQNPGPKPYTISIDRSCCSSSRARLVGSFASSHF